MGRPILYGIDLSPPVRTVLLTCKAIGLDIDYRVIDLLNQEHKKDEFLKKNPQHSVPTLVDDGKSMWDSHAICTYLVGKYGKNDSLYPKDLYQRALIDQRLHFDSGVLFIRLRAIHSLIIYKNQFNISKELIDNLYEAYDFVEKFLENGQYLVGNTLTVADFSCIATISSGQKFAPVTSDRYPKMHAWMKRLESLPYYEEANGKGARDLIAFITKKIETLTAKSN